ncbi:MAG TPA: zinc ribbon domain-containing protein [Gemmatimonadaceae bacterium]
MPTYEFRCPNGHTFDRFYRSIGTSEAQTACPVCGEMAERQVSGGAGLLFKGSGFYLTDYGKDAHKKKAPESKSESAKTEGGRSESASSGSSESSGASKSSDSKPAESKPAAPPKPSSGE